MGMKKIVIPDDTWIRARTEFATDKDISIREICRRYHLPYNQTLVKSKAEDWEGYREQVLEESRNKSVQALSDEVVKSCIKAYRVADKLLDKLEEVVDRMDTDSPTILDDIKNATYSMKNLKEIGLFKATLDEQEQMARIEKLRREAEHDTKDSTITVVFDDATESFSE